MEIFHHQFTSLESTNCYAKQHAQKFERNVLSVISTSEQTQGRARGKKSWVSPTGNIYASFCFYISKIHQELNVLSQLMALACTTTLEQMDLKPQIKWPNDLLVDKKKVAGILCELYPIDYDYLAIIGLGMNVNMTQKQLDSIDQPTTSLSLQKGKLLDINTTLDLLKVNFHSHLTTFLEKGFSPFFDQLYQRMPYKPNQIIKFSHDGNLIQGRFDQLNPNGSLSLIMNTGEKRNFTSGEIIP